jgi:oxygen-dependent protoporphyrinogen oxidase
MGRLSVIESARFSAAASILKPDLIESQFIQEKRAHERVSRKKKLDTRIAVIGAGISGLSAGYHLIKAGLNPVIFERESFVGGRMSSERVDKFVIDKAAYILPEFYHKLNGFVNQVGMDRCLVQTSSTSATFLNGKGYPIKISSPSDFLGYRLLSFQDKKNIVKLFLYARSLGKALNLGHPSLKTLELENESVSDYLIANYGEQILERVAYPIFCEIFLGIPESNSKISLLFLLRNLMKFNILAFKDGMGSLPDHLERSMDIRLTSPVMKITPQGENGPYQVEVGGPNPGDFEFDSVVMAIPLPLVPKIIEDLPEKLKRYCLDILYAPSIVVALAAEKAYQKTAMIKNLLRTEFNTLGTVVLDHHKSPRRVPDGKTLATAILREQASRRLFYKSEAKIIAEVLFELDTLFPEFSRHLTFSRIYRWKYGALQLPPGLLAKRNTVLRFLEGGLNNIYFAGESSPLSSLEASFNTGLRAANQIIMKRSPHDHHQS